MRGLIENNEKSILNLSKSCAKAYKDCFTSESTEHWVRRFAKSHYETIYLVQIDQYDNKLSKKYEKVFIDNFTDLMLKHIETLKKTTKKKEV